jgi:cytidyltransferase-like protein
MKNKVLLETWKRFLNESNSLPEGVYPNFGLVPMSAKPFHEGHMELIRKASDECREVIVYVSTSDRKRKGETTIHGEDMEKIWKDTLVQYMPDNVILLFGGSPVRNVYTKLGEGLQDENKEKSYAVYTGEEDKGRYNSKYYSEMIDRVYIRTLSRGEDTKAISGTLMRAYLSNASEDKFLFLDGLPSEIKDEDKELIFNILFSRLN